MKEQYYVFTGPDGWAWVEMFFDGRHVTAPSPRKSVSDQIAWLESEYPTAIVDELMESDIADAMEYQF